MHFKHNVSKVVFGIALIFLMGTIMVLMFVALNKYNVAVLNGALLGCVFASLIFLSMMLSVKLAMENERKKAIKTMIIGYAFRLILILLAVSVAVLLPNINLVSAVVPLLFSSVMLFLSLAIDFK